MKEEKEGEKRKKKEKKFDMHPLGMKPGPTYS